MRDFLKAKLAEKLNAVSDDVAWTGLPSPIVIALPAGLRLLLGERDRADRRLARQHVAAARSRATARPASSPACSTMRERMIGALLLGNNIANIGASALATGIFTAWFGEVGVLYATGVMTVLVVIFAEVLPKTMAINAPDRVALLVARPMKLMVCRARAAADGDRDDRAWR